MKNAKPNYKLLLVAANVLIVAAILLNSIFYARRQGEISEANAKSAFVSTATSMQKVAHGFMSDQQLSCNEWASYITSQNCTAQQAMETLMRGDVSEHIVFHIVDYETLGGYAAITPGGKLFEESFADTPERFAHVVSELGEYNIRKTHITQFFVNPVDGMFAIGFCQDVTLAENGSEKHYMLMRSVRMDYMSSQLVFPGYEKATLSLVTSEGDFVLRPATVKLDNFWEYLQVHNKLSFEERDAIKAGIDSETIQHIEMLDKFGVESLFVCLPAEDDDWQFVAYIQKELIINNKLDLTLVFIVLLGLALIIGLDGAVLMYTNKRLAISAEETRRANLAKTRFLSSMSHDIRTPMNAIVGMSAIAMRRIESPEHVKECLKKITLASNHLLTLINDILDISKIESGKLTLNPVVFSLAESFENLMNIVRIQIREKDISFEAHASRIANEYVFADELRLNQIFINILSNAIKYTKEGGKIVLTLNEEPVEGDSSSVLLTYSVADTGIGMSEEFQKTMYDSFSRAVDTRVNKILGTGLGLAITKQMVDLMGGTIDCQSVLGEGTTFTVKIKMPLSENPTDGLALPPIELLLVDDDEVFLETAADTFGDLGVTAEVAKSGERAVEMVLQRHAEGKDYPVVVIDWKMPGMDGIETTRRIRAEAGGDVSIVVISAYDWTEIEEEALAAGADAFINKPFFRSTVYYKMSELLKLETGAPPADFEDFSDLRGKKLLVAEDNDLNWEIISELLGYHEIAAARVTNGKACVEVMEKAKEGDFDAVLMDVQMPIMDGKEATRRIRALENEFAKGITIIAMTADAFAEDIQSCLAAGMDGHVAKPIDLKKLLKELRRTVGGRRA